MSMTDQKPRQTTQEDLNARWDGAPPGVNHRCYLCGYKFKLGDTYRWVYANHIKDSRGNFVTCELCDGPDVLERWLVACKELMTRFWWADPLHRRCGY